MKRVERVPEPYDGASLAVYRKAVDLGQRQLGVLLTEAGYRVEGTGISNIENGHKDPGSEFWPVAARVCREYAVVRALLVGAESVKVQLNGQWVSVRLVVDPCIAGNGAR